MSNIYDLFNNRKEGLTSLQEGFGDFELEEVTLENFEDPVEALEEIVEESAMDFIQLQANLYMDDLLIENAMYEDFDEEAISELMESTMKEKSAKLSEAIKKQWAKLVAWFKQTLINVQNFFTDGETLVSKYKNQIPEFVKNCDTTVSTYRYVASATAISNCESMISKVKYAGVKTENLDDARSNILKMAGATDRKGVAVSVKKQFIGNADGPATMKISSLDPKILMEYAGSKKDIIDGIKKTKAIVDKEFQAILNDLKVNKAGTEKGEERKDASKAVAVFNFAISVKTAIINAMISCVKKASSDSKAIIRKAIGGKASEGAINKANAKQQAKADAKFQRERMKAARKSVKEALDFEEICFED